MMTKLYTRVINAIAETKDNDEGVTAIEYGLLAALIAIAFTAGATAVGGGLQALFDEVAGQL